MEPIQSDMPFADGWSAEKFKEFLCIVNAKYYDQIIEVYEELSVIIMEEEKEICPSCGDEWTEATRCDCPNDC